MGKSVLIVTYDGSPWLNLNLKTKHKIEVVDGKDTFDPMGFYYAVENNIDEFVLLHDSMRIKDPEFLDSLFDYEGNVGFLNGFLMCIGKYSLKHLKPLPPMPKGKHQAIGFESDYCSKIDGVILFPELCDNDKRVYKNGRENLIIENDKFIKYKGFWNMQKVNEVYGFGDMSVR